MHDLPVVSSVPPRAFLRSWVRCSRFLDALPLSHVFLGLLLFPSPSPTSPLRSSRRTASLSTTASTRWPSSSPTSPRLLSFLRAAPWSTRSPSSASCSRTPFAPASGSRRRTTCSSSSSAERAWGGSDALGASRSEDREVGCPCSGSFFGHVSSEALYSWRRDGGFC